MDGFSKEWDDIYRGHTHMSVWPWSDLVSFTMRHASPLRPNWRVLEFGCGAGANIPFFLSIGVQYFAIEGSECTVRFVKERHPSLVDHLATADFTNEIPFDGQFDLIVDRAAVTHNSEEAIRRCLALARSRLAPGGRYIGIDWFADGHSDEMNGEPAEDARTRTNYRSGPFRNVGRVHFSDREHLSSCFRDFGFEVLERKVCTRALPDRYVVATWNFVTRGRES